MRSAYQCAYLLAGAVLALAGCGGAQEKPDNTAWETRTGFRQLGAEEPADAGASRRLGFSGFDWLGVRHDLIINPDHKQSASCSCLAVRVGSADDPEFVWRGGRPDLNPANMVLAISAFGVDCPDGAANPADRRPSIRAVDRAGKDIVVEIEELPPGRPIATGAVMKPLEPGGHIYIRPRSKALPYARPSGKELCRVK
ncbi:MAG: hypothetical protein U0271_45875 [Polyangiaceae bacterium]